MEPSSSSKVTVEYHDPSGVFPLISHDLASRLPLRNLNWKSPTRPLRSIGALHVEFVPDAATAAKTESPALQRADSYGPGAVAINGSEIGNPGGKERRHQIPGLLQTPYLKIYLLRCDDKDTYKASSRQLLRDWINQNTPSAKSSSQLNKSENHDACEWLILHVVIPDTVAASEPRWTASTKKDQDELVERPQSATKWPGKSTRTVLDKIRADFNASTKSATERVAQLRLQKAKVPAEVLPQTPVLSLYTESPQEQDNAWQDLVAKFKILILMSFDLRVSQYEDGIREKDAQRSLPGWNFCTFFTLKEGLARGFESVGLVEDALAIYDELSAGLDTAVRDSAPGSDASQSTFLGDLSTYRAALQQTLISAFEAEKVEKYVQELFVQPLDLTKKDYRGDIVKNSISLFDFHLYIFARQRTLLLRLGVGIAPAQQKRPQSAQGPSKDDNLVYPAEVCRRAAAFAATNSRALRNGLQEGSENEASSSQYHFLVENVTSSWTYSVLDQILSETASDKLQLPKTSTEAKPLQRLAPHGSNFNFPQGANTHPNRSSSLRRGSLGSSSTSSSAPIYNNDSFNKSSTSSLANTPAPAGSGIVLLAAGRAELLAMQRKIVESMAKRKGWLTGWTALVKPISLSDVDLRDNAEVDQTAPVDSASQPAEASERLLNSSLASSLASIEDFRAAYEQLSNLALAHYALANHAKSSDMVTSDLAVLKYQVGDYAQAATLFQKSSQSYLQTNWTHVHGEMLRAYAKCLKELHRKDEYMRVMLSLLSKVIARQRAQSLPKVRFLKPGTSLAWLDDNSVDVSGILAGLVAYSQELPYNFTAALADFFSDAHVSQEVSHYDEKDGFSLDVEFRHLLEDDLKIDRVRLRLTNSTEPGQEIWLQSDAQMHVEQGLVKLRLHSNITTHGHYLIDRLILETNKLHFLHEFQPKPKPTPLGISNVIGSDNKPVATGPFILLYPHEHAFEVRASLTRRIHVDQLRSLVFDVETGHNDIDSLDLRLRSASAGLRLHTADAVILDGAADLDISQGGLLHTGALASKSHLRVSLPYSVEHTLHELTVRLEALYKTEKGEFVFASLCTIPVDLPLDVDVHDIFKAEKLFSRFNVRTTTSIPLQVSKVHLEESPAFSVKALPCPSSMTVFEKQPASLTYSISKKPRQTGTELSKKEAALAMTVQYICIDEVILDKITTTLSDALEGSPFSKLKRLLLPLFRSGAQSYALALQFETAVLLRELTLPAYDTIGWDKAIATLPSTLSEGLAEWLHGWHKQNKRLQFDPTTVTSLTREITIAVDVPTIDIVHTAALTLSRPSSSPSSSSPPPTTTSSLYTATLGTPIPAILHITHTRRWGTAPTSTPLDFVYTLRSPAETWLIGGQRRAHFTLGPASAASPYRSFPIILIPLKAGAHLLPTIDISAVAPADGPTTAEKRSSGVWQAKRPDAEFLGAAAAASAAGGPAGEVAVVGGFAASGESLLGCETEYLSSGTVVLVTRDARVTGVTVGESAGAGVGVGGSYVDAASVSAAAAAGMASEDTRLSRVLS